MVTAGVIGPAWADTSGRLEVVRNPLRIQNHVSNMVAALLPGVIVTTTLARYYLSFRTSRWGYRVGRPGLAGVGSHGDVE